MPRTIATLALVLAVWGVDAPRAETLGYYEWVGVAPIVATGTSRGEFGRNTWFTIDRVLRGDGLVSPGQLVHILVRRANRDRNMDNDRKPLHLAEGESYIVLLTPSDERQDDGVAVFDLARGVRGARGLPAEGGEALIRILERFIEIQSARSDAQTWNAFAEMLEESDPVLLQTALDQFVKFRRGSAILLPALRRTLDHPDPALRERAARLIGQIVERDAGNFAVGPALHADLVGHARRDAAVAVRVAATMALGKLTDESIGRVLQEIAESDPDQTVRYAAETLIYERERAAERPKGEGTSGGR